MGATEADTPMGQFLRNYILDILGCLPSDLTARLDSTDFSSILGTSAGDWRGAIKEALHLSETFHIAVLDIWYRNREELGQEVQEFSPESYAYNFVNEYLKEGSEIDVWPGDALKIAKARVARYGYAV